MRKRQYEFTLREALLILIMLSTSTRRLVKPFLSFLPLVVRIYLASEDFNNVKEKYLMIILE